MLCFDIETTGLDPDRCKVTVVCTEDFVSGVTRAYEFAQYPEKFDCLREDLIAALEESPSLCAFNGIRFDIPFLAKYLKISNYQQMKWMTKTSDILEQSRLRFKKTFSLNLLCETNNIPIKISDGKEAIKMAENKEWSKLRSYCAKDVSILCDIYRKQKITHPRTNKMIDLKEWSRDKLYDEEPCFLHHVRTNLLWTPQRCVAIKNVFRNHTTNTDKIEALKDRTFDTQEEKYVLFHNEVSSEFEKYLFGNDSNDINDEMIIE